MFIYLTAIGLLPGGSVDKKKNIHSTKKQPVPHEITQHEYNDIAHTIKQEVQTMNIKDKQ
jgi:hypothetical protein